MRHTTEKTNLLSVFPIVRLFLPPPPSWILWSIIRPASSNPVLVNKLKSEKSELFEYLFKISAWLYYIVTSSKTWDYHSVNVGTVLQVLILAPTFPTSLCSCLVLGIWKCPAACLLKIKQSGSYTCQSQQIRFPRDLKSHGGTLNATWMLMQLASRSDLLFFLRSPIFPLAQTPPFCLDRVGIGAATSYILGHCMK